MYVYLDYFYKTKGEIAKFIIHAPISATDRLRRRKTNRTSQSREMNQTTQSIHLIESTYTKSIVLNNQQTHILSSQKIYEMPDHISVLKFGMRN